ncbi:unnamed protein product [Lathyrus sativus]|nr:unnamed protein product [Lathyrus sativus]
MVVEFVALEIINGEIEMKIDESDVEDELDFWSNVMILFALGDSLSMNAVKKFMENSWSFVTMSELCYNEKGFFIVRFKSEQDREDVMSQIPYFVYGKLVFIRIWSPDFEIKDDLL